LNKKSGVAKRSGAIGRTRGTKQQKGVRGVERSSKRSKTTNKNEAIKRSKAKG
jgi:hypothetical protein